MIATTDNATPEAEYAFPPTLAAICQAEFAYDDGDGIDFEPYDAFLPVDDATAWLRQWTGNHDLDGSAYRFFGQDGTGGGAALWSVREGRPLADQPVVFLSSEGETAVVAGNLSDFLWVLADGFGPLEATLFPSRTPRQNDHFASLAHLHATTPCRSAHEIFAEARTEFPTFDEDIEKLCR
ncbi:SMI1/KNR4 family protein [Streptomyces sp. Act143]|uniref:SMI1/KNR4 family protein n=1 Tax=Streptomyces sp. Act143 TaxID=2200760 RepID=UPI000D678CB3|nr:SMI1/KNR4 family protein [Streptomyces sp. Act143]PWI17436.1 SMI1/KNR4 family protein [Streptomyces sp. Act143]